MARESTVKIQFNWITSEVDPFQYKPQKPILAPIGLLVEVEIPNKPEYIVKAIDAGITVLTPAGMAYALNQISLAMAKEHLEK
jgi:hypothetical protein